LKFFNPFAEIQQTANRLPHWQQEGAVYFVTFRLSDSVPSNLRERWEVDRRQWLTFNPLPWSPKIEEEYHTGSLGKWSDGSMRVMDHAWMSQDAVAW